MHFADYLILQNCLCFPSLVLISYSHTHNPALPRSPLSIVTALVDKIGKTTTGHLALRHSLLCEAYSDVDGHDFHPHLK